MTQPSKLMETAQSGTALKAPPEELLSIPAPRLPQLAVSTSAPAHFVFGEITASAVREPVAPAHVAPSLGAISAFAGNWAGSGFNTVFRPNSPVSPTRFPVAAGGDNVLELNLTAETLSFSGSLGSVPNRGMLQQQPDAFLNGVTYLQSISDVTIPGQSVGIHVEPGLWMAVPTTRQPSEGPTYSRMASIPHGTTIAAQGTATTFAGPPTIPPVDITPSFLSNGQKNRFASQTASAGGTARLPQDLTAFVAAGRITQAMLDDPNAFLRVHLVGQDILETTQIQISTIPAAPLFGGGTDNIAFLLGDGAAASPNANAARVNATFWIETVRHTLAISVGQVKEIANPVASLAKTVDPAVALATGMGRSIIIDPPRPVTTPRTLSFTSQQIQYSQTVFLNFNGLSWPHVSVATLIPAEPLTIPASAWA